MLEERFRFIDLAVRPLGKSAEGELARGELMERLIHADPAAGDDTLAEATQRLEEAGARWRRRSILTVAGIFIMIGVMVVVLGGANRESNRLSYVYPVAHSWGDWLPGGNEEIAAGRSIQDRVFLLSNSKNIHDEEVVDWLKAAAKNPSGELLEEIAVQRRVELPQDLRPLLLKVASLEPENGRWQLDLARDYYTSSASWPGMSKTRYYDGEEFRQAVKLLEEAAARPSISSSLLPHTRRRLDMIGPVTGVADQVALLYFLSTEQPRIPSRHRLPAPWVMRGDELVDQHDPAAWQRWVSDWAKVHLALPPFSDLQTELQEIENLATASELFADQARRLGLTAERKRLIEIRMLALTAPRALTPAEDRIAATLVTGDHAGLGGGEAPEAYMPGRMAEYALADRYSALAAALAFTLLGGLAFLEGWRRLPAQRGLAAGLMALFKRRDFAWLAGLGILLPLLWHIAVIRFTPLGCRDLGLNGISMVPPAVLQIIASVLFAWCMLLQTARWRIAKRAGLVGLRCGGMWVGWTAAAIAALCVPAAGILRYLPPNEEYLLFGVPVLGLPTLWLIWRTGLAMFQPREAALGGVLACRLLVPLFTAAAALCLLLMFPLRAEEKKWVALDHLGGPDPAGSLMQEREARGLDRLRGSLKEAWEKP